MNYVLQQIKNILEKSIIYQNKHKIKITKIGVIKSTGYRYSLNSKQYNPKVSGYDHFKGK